MEIFDARKAHQLIKDAICLTRSQRPPGALEWLEANRPDLIERMQRAGTTVDRAFEAENSAELHQGLLLWSGEYSTAFNVFSSRPPVIERRADGNDE